MKMDQRSQESLLRIVQSSLEEVATEHRTQEIERDGLWFSKIATAIAQKTKPFGLKCYAKGEHRGQPAPECAGNEWLFDFCALIDDPSVPEQERFMTQAALVGEIEWTLREIDQDFEKLMIAESLCCFFVFQARDNSEADPEIQRLTKACERRRVAARERGIDPPPAFLIGCLTIDDMKFKCVTVTD